MHLSNKASHFCAKFLLPLIVLYSATSYGTSPQKITCIRDTALSSIRSDLRTERRGLAGRHSEEGSLVRTGDRPVPEDPPANTVSRFVGAGRDPQIQVTQNGRAYHIPSAPSVARRSRDGSEVFHVEFPEIRIRDRLNLLDSSSANQEEILRVVREHFGSGTIEYRPRQGRDPDFVRHTAPDGTVRVFRLKNPQPLELQRLLSVEDLLEQARIPHVAFENAPGLLERGLLLQPHVDADLSGVAFSNVVWGESSRPGRTVDSNIRALNQRIHGINDVLRDVYHERYGRHAVANAAIDFGGDLYLNMVGVPRGSIGDYPAGVLQHGLPGVRGSTENDFYMIDW